MCVLGYNLLLSALQSHAQCHVKMVTLWCRGTVWWNLRPSTTWSWENQFENRKCELWSKISRGVFLCPSGTLQASTEQSNIKNFLRAGKWKEETIFTKNVGGWTADYYTFCICDQWWNGSQNIGRTFSKKLRKNGDLYVIVIHVAWLRTCLSFKILGSVHKRKRLMNAFKKQGEGESWRTFGWTWAAELFFWTYELFYIPNFRIFSLFTTYIYTIL